MLRGALYCVHLGIQSYALDGTKITLNQDMFLIGTHSPLRRWLAFRFCGVTNRECEYVALTSDTSEADLKARKDGLETDTEFNCSVVWFDQAVVRAATLGRVLILEGLEKAERNVLPVLNNLLENRECSSRMDVS